MTFAATEMGILLLFATALGEPAVTAGNAACQGGVGSCPMGGNNLLTKKYWVSRNSSIDAGESSLMALGALSLSAAAQVHREWVRKHETLEDTQRLNTGVFDRYAQSQTKFSDSCSARLLQDKIALDKLQAEVDTLGSQMKGEQTILDTEQVALAALKDEFPTIDAVHAEDIKSCEKKKEVAEAEVEDYKKEFEELWQIANPSKEEFEGGDAPAALLAETHEGWSNNQCLQFLAYMRTSKMPGEAGLEEPAPSCAEQRAQLQGKYNQAVIDVENLRVEAQQRADSVLATCSAEANAKRTRAKASLAVKMEAATTKIADAEASIAALKIDVESANGDAYRAELHVNGTTGECKNAESAKTALQGIRDLIRSLRKCPRAKDFVLKMPSLWVKFSSLSGVTSSAGAVKRTKAGNDWMAGAVSASAIEPQVWRRGVRVATKVTNFHGFVGLTSKAAFVSAPKNYVDIDFGFHFAQGDIENVVHIYEHGKGVKMRAGVWSAGETYEVTVNDSGEVEYFQGGTLLYTSEVKPEFPLYVAVSIAEHNGEFVDVEWTGAKPDAEPAEGTASTTTKSPVKGPVTWRSLSSVTASSGSVRNANTKTGWHSSSIAVSEFVISQAGDAVRGITGDAKTADFHGMIGFTSDSTADSCKDIDFALYADHGNVRVYEKYEKPDKEGKLMGNAMGYRSNHKFGTYVGGETFQVAVNSNGQVEYFQDSKLLNTSKMTPKFPLYGVVCFGKGNKGEFNKVDWIAGMTPWVKFSSLSGLTSSAGAVKRTKAGKDWFAGAVSASAITQVGGTRRGVRFAVKSANFHGFVGLMSKSAFSSTPEAQKAVQSRAKTKAYRNNLEIDFGLYFEHIKAHKVANDVDVWESGKAVKSMVSVISTDETYEVTVNDSGEVEYFQGETLLYTSKVKPQFPLYVAVSIMNHNGEFVDVEWTGGKAQAEP